MYDSHNRRRLKKKENVLVVTLKLVIPFNFLSRISLACQSIFCWPETLKVFVHKLMTIMMVIFLGLFLLCI